MMSPRLVWSMADGYPVVLKQFIQFCLILIYPAWVFAVLVGGLFQLALLRDGLPAAVAALLAGARVPEEEQSRGVRREPGEVHGQEVVRDVSGLCSDRSGGASSRRDARRSSPRARPCQATVTTDKPIDKVTVRPPGLGLHELLPATTGPAASTPRQPRATTRIWTADQVGTNYGGDRDTDDWVSVIVEDVPDRHRRVHRRVVDVPHPVLGTRVVAGDRPLGVPAHRRPRRSRRRHPRRVHRAHRHRRRRGLSSNRSSMVSGAAETVIDIALSTPVWRAGETITGHVTLTPTIDLPDGDLAVSWQRERESHPLTRTPGPGGQLDGRIVQLGKRIPLRAGVPVVSAVRDPAARRRAADRGRGALVDQLVRPGPADVRGLQRAPARTGAPTDRRRQRALTAHAREIADASATCSAVGRTPV